MPKQRPAPIETLSPAAIAQETGTELPERAALSLLSGDLFNPTMPP